MKKNFVFIMLVVSLVFTAVGAYGQDFEINGTTLVKYKGKGTNITIPSNVTVIGERAFSEYYNSFSVIMPSSVTTIEREAFSMSNITSINIPSSVTFIGGGAFQQCTRLTSITVDAQNSYFSSVDGVLFTKDKKILIQYPADKQGSSYTIPTGVTTVWYEAFGYCDLTSVTIPSSVTTIEDWAFVRSSLAGITIPSSVTSIGEYAFGECKSLTSVTLSRKTKIENDTFPSSAKITYSDSPASQPANAQYKIGDKGPAGGIVFYDKGNNTDGWRYLEAAPADLENSKTWDGVDVSKNGTETGIGSGKLNTELIIAIANIKGVKNNPAQLCRAYKLNGYSDWFLPSRDELDLMYKNLKQKGLGGFDSGWWYWSSSYNWGDNMYGQHFRAGDKNVLPMDKVTLAMVRPIRAF